MNKQHKAYLILDLVVLSIPLITIAVIIIAFWNMLPQDIDYIHILSLPIIVALAYIAFFTAIIRRDKHIAIMLHASLTRFQRVFTVFTLACIGEVVFRIPLLPIVSIGSIIWILLTRGIYLKQSQAWYEKWFGESIS